MAVGEPDARVSGDLQEEVAVSSGVGCLAVGRTAKWSAAKDERSCVVSELLVPLLADELNRFELFEGPPGDANMRQERPCVREAGGEVRVLSEACRS